MVPLHPMQILTLCVQSHAMSPICLAQSLPGQPVPDRDHTGQAKEDLQEPRAGAGPRLGGGLPGRGAPTQTLGGREVCHVEGLAR